MSLGKLCYLFWLSYFVRFFPNCYFYDIFDELYAVSMHRFNYVFYEMRVGSNNHDSLLQVVHTIVNTLKLLPYSLSCTQILVVMRLLALPPLLE